MELEFSSEGMKKWENSVMHRCEKPNKGIVEAHLAHVTNFCDAPNHPHFTTKWLMNELYGNSC